MVYLVRYKSNRYFLKRVDSNPRGIKAFNRLGSSREVDSGVDKLDTAMRGAYVSGSALLSKEAKEELKV